MNNLVWIEVGYVFDNLTTINPPDPCNMGTHLCYFWADDRPCVGITGTYGCQSFTAGNDLNNYFVHWVSNVPSTDFGSYLPLSIYTSSTQQCNNYTVYTGTPHGAYYNISANNCMYPAYMTIGAELVGYSGTGQQVPLNYWYNSEWANGGALSWTHWTTNGNFTDMSPLSANWYYTPSSGQFAGGMFFSGCGYSGPNGFTKQPPPGVGTFSGIC